MIIAEVAEYFGLSDILIPIRNTIKYNEITKAAVSAPC